MSLWNEAFAQFIAGQELMCFTSSFTSWFCGDIRHLSGAVNEKLQHPFWKVNVNDFYICTSNKSVITVHCRKCKQSMCCVIFALIIYSIHFMNNNIQLDSDKFY